MSACPKCGGSMDDGFIGDVGYGTLEVPKWQSGAPQKSFWSGTRKGDPQIAVSTLRCNRCGYLESYAR